MTIRTTHRVGHRTGGLLKAAAVLLAAVLAALVPAAATATAAAQRAPETQAARDQVQIARLVAGPAPGAPEGTILFEALVDYRLQSTARGSLVVFVFEEDAETASEGGTERIPVATGTGREVVRAAYQPKTSIDSVTVLVGLFQENQLLLAWSATNPVSLTQWPGRSAFNAAMAARLAGDHKTAVARLTEAINAGQPTSQYFYWRADSRVHLGDHEAAIQDYTQALDLAPRDRVSRVGRGVALIWMQEWEAAVADLSRAIEETSVPDRPLAWAHRARGVAHAALGRDAEAVADYRMYLALLPTAPDRADVEAWIAELS